MSSTISTISKIKIEESTDAPDVNETLVLGLDEEKVTSKNSTMTLTDNFGESFVVKKTHLALSKFLADLATGECDKINLSRLKKGMLKYIVQYLDHHKGNDVGIPSKPLKSKKMIDVCEDKWDAEFVDNIYDVHGIKFISNFVDGANFLIIRSLLYLICAKIASLIKGEECSKVEEILGGAIPDKSSKSKTKKTD